MDHDESPVTCAKCGKEFPAESSYKGTVQVSVEKVKPPPVTREPFTQSRSAVYNCPHCGQMNQRSEQR